MQIKAIATIFGLVAATMAAPRSPPSSDGWSSDSTLSDSDPTGKPYGNPHGNLHGNPFRNPFGNMNDDKEKTYGDGGLSQSQKQSVTQIVKVDNGDKEYGACTDLNNNPSNCGSCGNTVSWA
jgi:hypothetical protein